MNGFNAPDLVLLSGRSNLPLSAKISDYLGIPLTSLDCKNFSDGEIQIDKMGNVRQMSVYIIQSTCPPNVNDYYIELFLLIDACKRASAKKITVVMPYYGYARQDQKKAPRVPISAKLMADLLFKSGAHRVIAMDLHAGQIQGFFDIPVDNLFASAVIIDHIKKKFNGDLVIVSPDAGGVERARAFAKRLNAGLAIIDKRRIAPNQAKAMNVIGEVRDKTAIILDDMVDTAGTLAEAAEALISNGAKAVHAACVHLVLSGQAIKKIETSPIISVIGSDSIPLSEKAQKCKKIEVLSVAGLIGEAIIRGHRGDSVSLLFV